MTTTIPERRIDRTRTDVGRVRIRTSGYSRDVHDGLGRMLGHLKRTGNAGLWRGIVAEQVNPIDLYHSYLRGELGNVVLVESVQSGKETLLAWHDTIAKPTTRKSYRQYITDLFRDRAKATVSQLPEVVQQVRERYRKLGQKNAFGQCKKVALSYASHT